MKKNKNRVCIHCGASYDDNRTSYNSCNKCGLMVTKNTNFKRFVHLDSSTYPDYDYGYGIIVIDKTEIVEGVVVRETFIKNGKVLKVYYSIGTEWITVSKNSTVIPLFSLINKVQELFKQPTFTNKKEMFEYLYFDIEIRTEVEAPNSCESEEVVRDISYYGNSDYSTSIRDYRCVDGIEYVREIRVTKDGKLYQALYHSGEEYSGIIFKDTDINNIIKESKDVIEEVEKVLDKTYNGFHYTIQKYLQVIIDNTAIDYTIVNKAVTTEVEETKTTPKNSQVDGDHYKNMKMDVVEFSLINNLDLLQFSAIKYICRHKGKAGATDINKAIHFLEMIKYYQYGGKDE